MKPRGGKVSVSQQRRWKEHESDTVGQRRIKAARQNCRGFQGRALHMAIKTRGGVGWGGRFKSPRSTWPKRGANTGRRVEALKKRARTTKTIESTDGSSEKTYLNVETTRLHWRTRRTLEITDIYSSDTVFT